MINLHISKGYLRLFLIIVFFALISTVPASAQQAEQRFSGLLIRTRAELGGFTYEFFMQPGERQCDNFIAQHDFETQQREAIYYTLVSDLIIDPDSRQPKYPQGTLELAHDYSLASWVTVNPSTVRLPYWGFEQVVDFCITVPEGASPGSHYAVLLLSNLTREQYLSGGDTLEVDASGAAIGSRSGVNLIVTVGGQVQEDLSIKSLDVLDIDGNYGILGRLFEYQPLFVRATLANSGNQFMRPAGNITIHQGDLVNPTAVLPFNPLAVRILPQTEYQYRSEWRDAGFEIVKIAESGGGAGDYRLQINPDKLSNLRWGRYFVTLQMTYRDINGAFNRYPDFTVEVWVIPWKIIIILVTVIGLYLWYRRRSAGKKVKYISRTEQKLRVPK